MIVIRMSRQGRTNRPHFRIGVYDVRTRRDGPPIEYLGHYDPLKKEGAVTMDDERVRYWLSQGAAVSETITSFLKRRGVALPVRTRAPKRRSRKAPKAAAPAAKPAAKPAAPSAAKPAAKPPAK
jgi:small subunit ribosomal protein S16